jgi:hypothetical protein
MTAEFDGRATRGGLRVGECPSDSITVLTSDRGHRPSTSKPTVFGHSASRVECALILVRQCGTAVSCSNQLRRPGLIRTPNDHAVQKWDFTQQVVPLGRPSDAELKCKPNIRAFLPEGARNARCREASVWFPGTNESEWREDMPSQRCFDLDAAPIGPHSRLQGWGCRRFLCLSSPDSGTKDHG